MVEKRYFLINKKFNLVAGGMSYETEELARAAIPECNIPDGDAKVDEFQLNFSNKIDYSKCTPLINKMTTIEAIMPVIEGHHVHFTEEVTEEQYSDLKRQKLMLMGSIGKGMMNEKGNIGLMYEGDISFTKEFLN